MDLRRGKKQKNKKQKIEEEAETRKEKEPNLKSTQENTFLYQNPLYHWDRLFPTQFLFYLSFCQKLPLISQ